MFEGSIVALITPMNNKGMIDYISLKKLIYYHINSGTSAIVCVGTTGESSTISYKEHITIVLKILKLSNNRIPIIVSITSNSTAQAIKLVRIFSKMKIAGFLIVTPYYNKPTQEGLYQHFKEISKNTILPQILYNIPSRTGCDLLPITIARLSKINNIVAIKEATGNLDRIKQINQIVNDKNFILLSGDDLSSLEFMKLGGKGIISVTANIAAYDMVQLCSLVKQGKFIQANYLNQRLLPLHKNLFIETNPIPIKWACKMLGLIKTSTLRLPMTKLSKNSRKIIKDTLKKVGLL
ncbi:4-hydroxy-tetrahydrodipicolinate synthase [Serratia symbiotica]|nr:4-hydroxy-tetrahydrodipicolinate synthase [Serratia symbiotica]